MSGVKIEIMSVELFPVKVILDNSPYQEWQIINQEKILCLIKF